MKVYTSLAAALALTASFATFPAIVRAQAEEVVAAPIVSEVVSAVTPKKDPPGSLWLKAQVIHADSHSLIVQEESNPRMIHTFSYSANLQNSMQTLVNSNGNYRFGDKVKILYQQTEPGKFVALRIKGKPS